MPKTRVFISWSGDPSKAVATALRDWLPSVVQQLDPWMSDTDIPSGAHWPTEIRAKLEECEAGIVCVTMQNRLSHWLHFEAGALAGRFADSRVVIPYLFGITKGDLQPPLGHFQEVSDDRNGTFSLLSALNRTTSEPLPVDVLRKSFGRAWPDLEGRIEEIRGEVTDDAPPRRDDRELLEEILAIARNLEGRPGPRDVPRKTVPADWMRLEKDAIDLDDEPTNSFRAADVRGDR